MFYLASRAGRWPLALLLVALAACADETVGPKMSPPTPNPSLATTAILVTNTSGGTNVGSLRWAAMQYGGGTIQFDPSLAGDTIALDSTLVLESGETVEGPADKGITIKGRFGRVIAAPFGGTLRNVTVTGGAADRGSAIYADSYTGGMIVLDHTTVTGNQGQEAVVYGRGVRLLNSTVSGNTAYWGASGIAYNGLELTESTVALNGPAPGIGGFTDLWSPSQPSALLWNSIVAHNGVPTKNCKDSVGVWLGGPSISNDTSCGTSANMIVSSAQLYSLANNGGPTMTHALAYDSPAINAGAACRDVDQRYVTRDAKCDIGAFEFTDFTVVTITIDASVNVDGTTGAALVTGTVRCTRAGALPLGVQLNQTQKTGKTTTTVVRGNGTATVSCATTAQPWSISAAPWSGTFQNGNAAEAAFTNNAPVWVTPVSVDKTVKLIRRK